MKKLLIQLDSDKFPSSFDTITAYDAGADHVLAYGGIDNIIVTAGVSGVCSEIASLALSRPCPTSGDGTPVSASVRSSDEIARSSRYGREGPGGLGAGLSGRVCLLESTQP